MKTINTIIISGLVVAGLNMPVLAASLDAQMLEMNRKLDSRIEKRIHKIDEVVSTEMQAKAEQAAGKAAAHLVMTTPIRS